PRDLVEDPHLNAGGMVQTHDPRGFDFKVPGLPLELGGQRLPLRAQPPRVSQDAQALLASLGYGAAQIERLFSDKVVAAPA
ncbi:MAG TPA: CoA transferase, partial [Burkholderiales bacterium]|nr:CoA transferase [Burkholderiales bacterium]